MTRPKKPSSARTGSGSAQSGGARNGARQDSPRSSTPGGLPEKQRTPRAPRTPRPSTDPSQGSGAQNARPARSGGRTTADRAARARLDRAPKLDAPPETAVFRDRDGTRLTFPESALKRVAAQILTERRKTWRYRPFSFPLYSDKGKELTLNFDFYVYDAEDTVIRVIMVSPSNSRESWDRIGRFRKQYPMYTAELWTPAELGKLQNPRAQLGF